LNKYHKSSPALSEIHLRLDDTADYHRKILSLLHTRVKKDRNVR